MESDIESASAPAKVYLKWEQRTRSTLKSLQMCTC